MRAVTGVVMQYKRLEDNDEAFMSATGDSLVTGGGMSPRAPGNA
jgi:hypothetical protein